MRPTLRLLPPQWPLPPPSPLDEAVEAEEVAEDAWEPVVAPPTVASGSLGIALRANLPGAVPATRPQALPSSPVLPATARGGAGGGASAAPRQGMPQALPSSSVLETSEARPSSSTPLGAGLLLSAGEPPMSTATAARVAARWKLPLGQRLAIHMEVVHRKNGRLAKVKRQGRVKI